jgi:hypothetical protein
MLNQEDYQGQADDGYGDTGEYSDESQSQSKEVNPLEAKLAELQSQIASLTGALSAQQRPKQQEKEPELSDEQWAEIAKDPKLMGQVMKAQLNKTTSQIQKEQQKAQYDKMAEERFPALRSNQELQRKVSAKMQEMVEVTGEYKWDSPTLLLRAAEIVAPTVGGILEVNKRRDSGASSLDASTNSVHRGREARTKIQDNDPRLQFAKAFGITDPKKLEAFKTTLGPYVPSQRKRGRSLMR